ncbi:MAG: alpha/beta hydrolase, partial [Anaerolineae bacterium]|nr:alpha/beta hydrolase [Anaerolineae bacterium]
LYKFLYGGVKLTPHYLAWVLNTFYTGNSKKLQANPLFKQILSASHADFKLQDLDAMIAYFYRMPDIDITPQIARIHAPTLVVVGDSDPLVNPNQSCRMVRHIPNSELKIMRHVGHVPMWENPEVYKKIISDWVEKMLQA